MKILKRMLLGLSVALITAIFFMACATMRKSDKQLEKHMQKNGVRYEIVSGDWEGKPFRYLSYKNGTKPLLVFVHGAPGSSSAFLSLFKDEKLLSDYSLIIPDRPGYGYTAYGKYFDIDKQSGFLAFLLKNVSDSIPVILNGHSFGAPIAAKLVMQQKANVKGLVMVGGAIDPSIEKYFFMGKLAYWPATRWMFSKAIQVSASEKYDHQNQLKQMANEWKNIALPVLMIHGDKDWLVPFENTVFATKNMNNKFLKVYKWENESHFIPFTKPKEMMQLITNWINNSVTTNP